MAAPHPPLSELPVPVTVPLQVDHEESQGVPVGLRQLTNRLVHRSDAVVLIWDFWGGKKKCLDLSGGRGTAVTAPSQQ